jgi:hypothetical protein
MYKWKSAQDLKKHVIKCDPPAQNQSFVSNFRNVASAFHQYIRYYNNNFWQKYGHLNVQSRDNRNFTKSKKFAS